MILSADEKIEVIRTYARESGLRTFVETGTATGNTPAALLDEFDHLYTIELDDAAYLAAWERFVDEPKVTVLYGDSAQVLTKLCPSTGPALYWLDGHFCGGVRGGAETPVLAEIESILAYRQPNVILIDDIRLFGVDPEPPHTERWPSVSEIEPLLKGYTVTVEDDILRAVR